MLKYVLLGALTYQPLTGYQMKQFVDTTARLFWHAQTSQIYRTLDALEDDGLVSSEVQVQTARPDRRLYTITEAGRADLSAWLHQPMTETMAVKDALMIRVFFGTRMDKDDLLTQLRLQRSLYERELTQYRTAIPAQIAAGQAGRPELRRDALLWDAARRSGEIGVEAYLRWLDETIARIEADW